jgi:hypothetical protein
MKLDNHIASKLLTDKNFVADTVIDYAKEIDGIDLLKSENIDADLSRYDSMAQLLGNNGNKNYYVTKTVMEHMHLFDTKKCMVAEGWRIFKGLPEFKKTFILPDPSPKEAPYGGSRCLRVRHGQGMLHFFYIEHHFFPKEKRTRTIDGESKWTMLYVDLQDEKLSDHINSPQGKALAPFLYALMCFVELCDNQVVEVQPKAKYGTQKAGKVINTLPFPITVITNTWNVTIIRKGDIQVQGHAQIYWTGPGRTIPQLIYKEPFTKEGYTRRSGKELAGE